MQTNNLYSAEMNTQIMVHYCPRADMEIVFLVTNAKKYTHIVICAHLHARNY